MYMNNVWHICVQYLQEAPLNCKNVIRLSTITIYENNIIIILFRWQLIGYNYTHVYLALID